MQRREFIAGLGSAAVAWPLEARAQQPAMPVIGFLYGGSAPVLGTGFFKGLNEMGYVVGRNVAVEYRYAENQFDRLPALAADLVRRRVAVIVATGGTVAVPAKAATTTIPIVFSTGGDPVALGLVASLNRPGANVTGVTLFVSEVVTQRLRWLRELVPQAATSTIGFLKNPTNPLSEPDTSKILAAARSVGQQISVLRASTVDEIDAAFAAAAERHLGALIVDGDTFFSGRPDQMAALAVRYKIPSSYATRAFAEAGGLMSYGDNRNESLRQAGIYVGRILKGDKPSDLPVLQPTKFELVVNLKTAKALGLTVPQTLLVAADEVIE